MHRATVSVLVLCLIGMKVPSAEMSGFDDLKSMQSKAGDAKKQADENQMSEEQFYRCFSDINCNLGKEAYDDIFRCYGIPNKTEAAEYSLWFEDSPKGNFSKDELNVPGVNKKFCTLTYEDQRVVNDHFAAKASSYLKDLCKRPGDRSRCLRLKRGTECISQLIESYVVSQKCKTIVNEVPIPEGAPTSLG